MRLNQGQNEEEKENLRKFAEWVLNIGDGKLAPPTDSVTAVDEDSIMIPADFCDPEIENSVKNMIEWTYPSFSTNFQNPSYLSERAIPTPTNVTVAHLNSNIVETIPGDQASYYSVDRAEEFGGSESDLTFVGTKHFIPRMELFPTETKLPFKLVRKQMPLQICYSMTINKAQGQSLERVGLYLPKSVFTHGQMYVAVSRVTSPQGLKMFIDSDQATPTDVTRNVVYKEIFYNLPKHQ
ncbi:hypothetical protein DCAR_0624127 [Daucus carota subsp. sativus]|uniref:DNA replication helicase domain-containing protein n=1 Tax=Daucus carota subsp. sativus TaxID=79200 RepID=A0AAF1B3E2_DAUCS|nr:hypothetical protein DCAR_0624127 [Daucus carota subsp. sativus]